MLLTALCLSLLAGCGAIQPVEKAKDVLDAGKTVVNAGKDVVETVKDVIPTADTSNIITEDEAKAIALDKAGLSAADARFTKTELDVNLTFVEYELEFTSGDYEYDCDVDANTGEVRSFEKQLKK